ncbi:inorganic phosphate transporter [Porphyromonas sp. COT-239 OH1446]|uniref:inorganic phosphate transporter n=1 Tax=Porphyromonas sp. COT-239 OH1446 TaxID=1515613 RepID=UPI00052D7A8D|nr:inorganic phosphate transporter [Porphyromonas sp. COT-239 OH1446]KGN67211.1 phosphate transporter family protein [Porphyromonas sp. COT-239 OH1446]
MEIIFTCILIFLAVLAIFDLTVGVSNDAVNFLNSAIGAKAAPFKVVLMVAAVGVFLGASLSNGMMEVARNGIYHPEFFTFEEVMIICLTAMVADVILLNIFNSLGLPTSTTVSLVFNLLGASFCVSLLKISADETGTLELMQLINTSKALQVIIAIFMSVVVAFFFGSLVQYITRVIFTFNYKRNLRYFAGVFGGIAITSIIYFMLIKGLKDAAFMTKDMKTWVAENTGMLLLVIFAVSAVVMQALHWFKVNIFKIIILAGTLALSMAFAGNDLVNFIGVPLSGLSAYTDYMAHGNGAYDTYLMAANNEPAATPIYYLLGSGLVMVLALVFSKQSQNVIKTSVNLSRQDDGEETFGSSRIARGLVRLSSSIAQAIDRVMPRRVERWLESRFNKEEIILEQGAAFDLVRASVNLVLAGLLIAIGTSMKLPLSTTYVTFMVAMGSSLADRAWGRESAVGRLTGVMSVIGGWFVTAGAAFFIAALVACLMYFGGFVAMVVLVAFTIFLLFNNHLISKKKADEDDKLFIEILNSEDPEEMWPLLSKHVRQTQSILLERVVEDYRDLTDAFIAEDFKTLRKLQAATEEHKRSFKTRRRKETICLRRMPTDALLEKNMWFHLGSNACLQMIYAIERSCEVCIEHVGNNFNPLPEQHAAEFLPVRDEVLAYLNEAHQLILGDEDLKTKEVKSMGKSLRNKVKEMRKTQMKRTHKSDKDTFKVSIVYMNMLQETSEILTNLRHLISYSQSLQEDSDDID